MNPALRLTSPLATVALASALGLFLELALIRWISSEVRVFAYFKNLVLVACFLGFGAGCFLARRRVGMARAALLLVLVVLVVRLPWPILDQYGPRQVSTILAELPGVMIFHHSDARVGWGLLSRVAFAVAWTAALFFATALVMLPFGQLTASGMARMADPLRAYSVNVAASLAGILAYTAACAASLPPLAWFVPALLGSAVLVRSRRERRAVLGLCAVLALGLLPSTAANSREIWSSYQKLELQPRGFIFVNNIGYQRMLEMPEPGPRGGLPFDRFTMPYHAHEPAGRVLVVGAGSGNDVAMALRAGATRVVAVEIDAVIQELGAARHPQQPYQDPRVHVVIDDARRFLRTTSETFDIIVFSHLDSHTVLSSYTSVRLDNYIYTVESFRDAVRRLAPGGLLYVSFFVEQPFIAQRLFRNLGGALGYDPVGVLHDDPGPSGRPRWNAYYLAGAREVQPGFAAVFAGREGYAPIVADPEVAPSTDDWPFLFLQERGIPWVMTLIAGAIVLLAGTFAVTARPKGERFDRRLFWMGAAFMLIEVHNVSRLALVFGTTWHVNAWVIGAILLVILLANAVTTRLRRAGRHPGRGAVAGLFVTLGLAWLAPLETVAALPYGLGSAAAVTLMTAPLFFAGLVFADAFADSTSPGFALGWNVFGAVVGGMTESVSYVLGIPALVPVAAVFYVLALWPGRRQADPALVPAPEPVSA
jgi:SAM-dependent methyltransferase